MPGHTTNIVFIKVRLQSERSLSKALRNVLVVLRVRTLSSNLLKFIKDY